MNFLKPFVFAPFILYIFNLMAVVLNIYIPINLITVSIVGLFGVSGLLMLILIHFILF